MTLSVLEAHNKERVSKSGSIPDKENKNFKRLSVQNFNIAIIVDEGKTFYNEL
jgi:hypothetical protein